MCMLFTLILYPKLLKCCDRCALYVTENNSIAVLFFTWLYFILGIHNNKNNKINNKNKKN